MIVIGRSSYNIGEKLPRDIGQLLVSFITISAIIARIINYLFFKKVP